MGDAQERLEIKLARKLVSVAPSVRHVGGKLVKVKGYKRMMDVETPKRHGERFLADDRPKAAEAHTGQPGDATLFQRQGHTKGHETALQKHLRLAKERERYASKVPQGPLHALQQAAASYRRRLGLVEPDVDWDGVVADLDKGKRVSRAFLQTPSTPDDPTVREAYRQLEIETDMQWRVLTGPKEEGGLGIKVEFVDEAEPYASAEEQADDFLMNGRLKIATISTHPASYHPLLGNDRGGSYDRFRAVHDAFGHVCIGGGFDRHGEYCAWIHHSSMFRDPARLAASTELHGENSVLWTTGEPPQHKAILLGHLVDNPIDPNTGEWVRFSEYAMPIGPATGKVLKNFTGFEPDEELFAYLESGEDYGEMYCHYDGIREVILDKYDK